MFEKLLNLILLNLGLMFAICALYWGHVMLKKDLANYRKRWAEATVRRAIEREQEAEREREAKERKAEEAEAERVRAEEEEAERIKAEEEEAERIKAEEEEAERVRAEEEKRRAEEEAEEEKRRAEEEAEEEKRRAEEEEAERIKAEEEEAERQRAEKEAEEETEEEVEIYKNDDGSYYYNDPESDEEISCDEDGNELDEETIRKNLMEGISKMSRIEELNVKLDSDKITPEEIEEFKKLLEEED